MENIVLPTLPLIGLIGGFFSGLLGLGGGVIMLPILTFVGGVPLKLATGTDLVHVFIASATGIFSHHRNGMVDLKAGLYLGISAIGGGLIGSFFSVLLSVHTLQLIYLGVVASAANVFLFTPLSLEKESYRKGDFHKVFGMAVGLGVGSLAGLLGVGGGFILIPLMVCFLKIPLRVTIGTSLMVILISSLGTVGAKYGVGHIDVIITLLVISGSVVGALFGAYVSQKIHIKFLRWILIFLLCLIFITVGYKTLF